MKIRNLLAIATLVMATFAQAAVIDWGMDTMDDTFISKWGGADVYTYHVAGSSTTSITDFISSWNYSYTAGTGVQGGKTGIFPADGYASFAQSVGTAPVSGTGYLVLIVTDGTNNIYSWSNAWTTRASVGDTFNNSIIAWFTEDGYDTTSATGGEGGGWTEFTTTVPEPTVLALLALGVAGLALKRKNA